MGIRGFFKDIKKPRLFRIARAFFNFSQDFLQRGDIHIFYSLYVIVQLAGDKLHTADGVALNIQRHNGVMDAEPQEKPSVAFVFPKGYPDALVIIRSNLPAIVNLGVGFQSRDHLLAAGSEILG